MTWRYFRRDDDGFGVLEAVIALVIVGGVLLVLLRGLDTALRTVVETRRQSAASALASELLERARSLEWDNIGLTDASNDADCPPAGDGVDGVGCGTWTASPFGLAISTDGDGDYTFEGEKVVFLNPASTFDPFLSFHEQVTRDNQTFDRFLFVTSVVDGSGAEQWRRMTAVVQWTAQTAFPHEVRQVTYASEFEEPSQPFVYGSVDYDGGFITISGDRPGNRGFVAGTSDWVDPADARPDLIATVELPDAQVIAVTDYVSGGVGIVQGTVGDFDWSDGKTTTVGRDTLEKRVDNDYGSTAPLNDPLSFGSIPAWGTALAAPHDFATREETDDGCCQDQITVTAQAWTQYTLDDLPYAAIDVDTAQAVAGRFTEYDGVGFGAGETFYLKGDGVPKATLNQSFPTATSLPNYDPGRDAFPGLLLEKTSMGLAETDPTKYQLWVAPNGSVGDIDIDGPVTLSLWSAMEDFDNSEGGEVLAALMECDSSGSVCSTITTSSLSADPWGGGSSTWVLRTVDFGTVTHSVSGSNSLSVLIVVSDASDDDMWFAYDTVSYPSQLNVNSSTLVGAPYEFTLFRHGAATGPTLHYEGTIDRYKVGSATRRVDITTEWDGETVYFAHDEVYGTVSAGAFQGWVRVDLPEVTATLSAGEVAPAYNLSTDNLTIWRWDPGASSYTNVYQVDYDSLTSVQNISFAISYDLYQTGYPVLRYDVAATLTVNPPVMSVAFDGNGARSNVIVQAPSLVTGTIDYRVEDLVPARTGRGLLYDVELVFGLGGLDANAQYINPEAP